MFFGPFWTWSCAILLTSSLTCVVSVAVAASSEPVNVVATIPVLKDLAEQVGGPYIRVTSLLKGYENEHTYSPKPSDLIAVRKARLLFEVGLGLEVWVATLVKNAGSASLMTITTSKSASYGTTRSLSRHTTGRDMNRAIPMSGWTPRTLRRCSGTSLMH
jgi:ABC-type Zn uptake system ZnuABC Zn-binding protein ZnuA